MSNDKSITITSAQSSAVARLVTKHLPCLLTDTERLAYADKLAEANSEIEADRENMKSMQKQMSNEVAAATARRDLFNRIVATKTEYRDVDVEIKKDYESGRIKQTRTDTGEVIVNRPMTQRERQSSLLDEGEIEDGIGLV